MIRCYVTDRRQADVVRCAGKAIADGVDLIQIREKDLSARELLHLACRVRDLAAGRATRILINDRLDIALAAGIAGVHLPSNGLPAASVRQLVSTLGISTHSLDEALAAEKAGVDFVIFGPVFETPGKRAVGLEALRRVTSAVRVPVLAIGGIRPSNAGLVVQAGAAGFAAIRMFQS
jgi:thiamine-phosphate pyrophosphorylase